MLNKSLTDLRTAIRQLSNTENGGSVSDPEVDARANEGLSALWDLILGTNETYFVKSTTPFTLAGGVGGNVYTLPTDYFKAKAVDKNPGQSNVSNLRPLPSFAERNTCSGPRYWISGNTLTLHPASSAAGTFQLHYTPLVPTLLDPTIVVQTGDSVTAASRAITVANPDTIVGLSKHVQLQNAAFTAQDVGKSLVLSGCANSANNGPHVIVAVLSTVLVAVADTLVDELLNPSNVTAVVTGTNSTATWHFAGAQFDQTYVGLPLVMANTTAPAGMNNGSFVIQQVVDATHVITQSGYPLITEVFPGPSVSASSQPFNTIFRLDNTLNVWSLYIELHAAIAIIDKRELGSDSLQGRLAQLQLRIEAAARNRREEPLQIPLVRRRSYWDRF